MSINFYVPKTNPELLSRKATHRHNGELVKIFTSTVYGNMASAELMTGPDKGKWTTVYLDKCEKID